MSHAGKKPLLAECFVLHWRDSKFPVTSAKHGEAVHSWKATRQRANLLFLKRNKEIDVEMIWLLGRLLNSFKRRRVFLGYLPSCMEFKVSLSSGLSRNLHLFFKKLTRFSYQLNSKNKDLVLFFETVFRHWNCFLSSVVMDDKDGRGLKLEIVCLTSSSFNTIMPEKFVWYLLFNSTWVFCGWGKALSTRGNHWLGILVRHLRKNRLI